MSTKIHALVETLGPLRSFVLTGGEVSDITQAHSLLVGIDTQAVVGDKGYDSDELVDFIRHGAAQAVIPPRRNRAHRRCYDTARYRKRNRIERFLCRINPFRRIATRYDKLAERCASFIVLTAATIWLHA